MNFRLPYSQALTNGPFQKKKKAKWIHDSSVVPAAVIAESPSVIVVHEARTPQPKAGSSHMGIDTYAVFTPANTASEI
jgi:hypothetical protein